MRGWSGSDLRAAGSARKRARGGRKRRPKACSRIGAAVKGQPMISLDRLLPFAFAIRVLFGCSKHVSRNIYEGGRQHNESLKGTPLENPRAESVSRDEYEKALRGTADR